ncbi:DUF7562 family protein [Halopiger xanaduensis]|uniref:Small CPxCG-related zinc finger protein n=1 Tax=Halopiger xanaduensis (strain DSM 18323 / JCM 14033 / SH-6) TaxID=797210 RepID=F8D7V0_HALXS|nr:hypothetical protein [Halopiger xanaduensis]AEH36681.1 hypothetical protein Halxa_2056 [Halopiger xanaduensis SH-6]
MWPWSSRNRTTTVTCLACGDEVTRSMAREYDKYGNRWDREDKEFEYLCKSCDRELCHHPRNELEDLLVDLEAGERDQTAFLARYLAAVEERYGPLEEPPEERREER